MLISGEQKMVIVKGSHDVRNGVYVAARVIE
jgi:hypothetical protein